MIFSGNYIERMMNLKNTLENLIEDFSKVGFSTKKLFKKSKLGSANFFKNNLL